MSSASKDKNTDFPTFRVTIGFNTINQAFTDNEWEEIKSLIEQAYNEIPALLSQSDPESDYPERAKALRDSHNQSTGYVVVTRLKTKQ